MLKKTINGIREFPKTLKVDDFNEAVTKHFVVLPILRDLGWNCDNLENLEVFPDKNTESGPVDYALQHDGKSRVFIVVKRWPTGSGPDELYDETAFYTSQEEVDFVVLTNGKTWNFYLPNLPDVPWETRRFCSIDLDNKDEAVSDFQKYLSRPHVLDASAREAAEAIVKKITPEKPNSQELLRRVRKIIREIEDKSVDGDYIFRGEPECYPTVSSTLYRQYEEIPIDGSNVEGFQNEMLTAAQEHLPGTTSDFETPVRKPDDSFETLTELQHYEGKTNLIDFTTDSRVALFFACDGSPGKKGRVILRKKGDRENLVEKPREPSNPLNRVIAQKSIFVRPRRGFVEFDQDKDVVEIPAALKKPMLEYLHKYHNISAKTIYNDLHGFIRTQNIYHRAYKELYRGLSCSERDEQDKAIQHFNKAMELKPDFFQAYNNRGVAYNKKDEFDRAIKDLNKAIELNSNLAEAYNNRGVAYDGKGEIDTAIHNYSKAIERKPVYAEAYYNRGTAYFQKGEVDNAIKDLTKTIELKPDDAEAYYNRGIAHSKNAEFDNAIQNYDKAIELKPDSAEVYNNRGYAYLEKGELDNAIKDLTTAIKLESVYAEAYINRGATYLQKGEVDNAINDFTTTIELKPDSAEAYCNRGVTYLQKGEVDNAIQNYDKAIEIKPDLAEAYCNRGEAWMHLGEWDKAKADLTLAKDRGMDIIASFQNDYENVADFEQKNGVTVPEDIKEMLTPA